MTQKTIALALLSAGIFMGLTPVSYGSKVPKGKTFSATVNDGTPKVLTRHSSQEDGAVEESLADLAVDTEEEVDAQEVLQQAPVVQSNVSIQMPPSSRQVKATKTFDERLLQRIEELEKTVVNLRSNVAASTDVRVDEIKKIEQTQQAPVQAKVTPKTVGEVIPQDKIEDIQERLKYTNQIIAKYGIAYDYRVMTKKDFIRILEKLENKKK